MIRIATCVAIAMAISTANAQTIDFRRFQPDKWGRLTRSHEIPLSLKVGSGGEVPSLKVGSGGEVPPPKAVRAIRIGPNGREIGEDK